MNEELEIYKQLIGKKIYVKSLNELPHGTHYVILEFSSVYIEGDERSKTHPGHGYPGYHQSYVEYIAYKDKSDWELAIKYKTLKKDNNYAAIIVDRPSININVNISIG